MDDGKNSFLIFKTNLNLKTELEFKEYLKRECLNNGFFLTKEQADDMIEFLKILTKENEKFNLTSIINFEDMVFKHIIDSLMIFKVIDVNKNMNLLDVGAGAGFPSTPIAILQKFKDIVQIDCLKKRINFLEDVAKKLKLNVKAYHARAEEAAKNKQFREKFDVVTARAVAKLNVLCELCIPFVKPNGMFVALKGPDYEKELEGLEKSIKLLAAKIKEIKIFKTTNGLTRVLILIKKISHTSSKYPRNFSKILKNPI